MSSTEDNPQDSPAHLQVISAEAPESQPSDPWARLQEAGDTRAYCAAWLEIQAALLSGALQAVVVLGKANRGPFAPVALWPEKSPGSPSLVAATEAAISQRRAVVQSRKFKAAGQNQKRDAIAYPLIIDEQLHGAVAFELEHHPQARLGESMRQLEWGAAWLEVLIRRKSFSPRQGLVTVLELVATSLHYEHFQEAATAAVTELAAILRCERVSISFLRGRRHCRIFAVSHSAMFSKKANIIRALEAAMDEAIDQQATVVYPPVEDGPVQVVRAHETLSREHSVGCLCTVPLVEGDRFLGALTLERSADEAFDGPSVQLCEHAAALLGPVLDVKRRDDRWLGFKAFDSIRWFFTRLLGPKHMVLKLTSLCLLALVVFFSVAEGEYRVTANAVLEGTIQRAVAAPMAGFVAQAVVRAGDRVRAGQLMVALDDRDLRLERLKWVSQQSQRQREYSEALAAHDRAKVRVLGAQIEQAKAQIALLQEQLDRSQIKAPFDGIVVAGDLSQSLGAPVERGDVLFEVAPLNSYRIILQVDERDVSQVAVGQRGELALTGMPEQLQPMVVTTITPVSTAEQGSNFFRVEAHLEKVLAVMRPGMEGVGKINVDRRKLAWIWTHRISQWVRMFIWSWWP